MRFTAPFTGRDTLLGRRLGDAQGDSWIAAVKRVATRSKASGVLGGASARIICWIRCGICSENKHAVRDWLGGCLLTGLVAIPCRIIRRR